jgi:hypothetical protein
MDTWFAVGVLAIAIGIAAMLTTSSAGGFVLGGVCIMIGQACIVWKWIK